MLRRTKTIAFDDEPVAEPALDRASRPSLRRAPDSLRNAGQREPLPFDPAPEPDAPANPVHQSFDRLRSEFDREPISRGAQESLAALREDFRRKHLGNIEGAPVTGGSGMPFGGLRMSRILLVLVALIAAGLAAWLAAGRTPEPVIVPAVEPAPPPPPAPTLDVLVARTVIPVGTRLTADLLEWQKWPEETVRPEYITSAATPEAPAGLAGSVVRSEIIAGEPLRSEKLSQGGPGYLSAILAPGKRAVAVSIDPRTGSGGFIAPDDRVDVVLTRMVGIEQTSRTILTNVRVMAINARVGGTAEAEPRTPEEAMFSDTVLTTLELDPAQAELIINAGTGGALSLVLRPVSDIDEAGTPDQQAVNQAIRLTSPFWTGTPPPAVSGGTAPLY